MADSNNNRRRSVPLSAILDERQKLKARNIVPGDTVTIQFPDGTQQSIELTEENIEQFKEDCGVGDRDRLAPQYTAASAVTGVGRINQFSAATCEYMGDIHQGISGPYSHETDIDRDDREKESRKRLKAEAKAQELLKQIIGLDQWKVYRKTNRIIVKPNKHFWIIGDMFGRFDKFEPFNGKPDVVRVDNSKKLHITEFCTIQDGGEPTPYTDKIIVFTSFLLQNENEFEKKVNRIGEKTLNSMKECAIWEVEK